jgi:hypothetical protein
MISNNKNIAAYEPGFGSKIIESMKYGLELVADFFVFLSKFWAIFTLGMLVYLLYKKYEFKIKK